MKKVIYTAAFGDYVLKEPVYVYPNWEYICFTDKNISSKNWKIIKIQSNDPRKISRDVKINSYNFFDYDMCLYIDSKFTTRVNNDIDIFSKNLIHDLCLMKHNKRNCLFDEGNFCILKKKDSEKIIQKQLTFYKQEGMPRNFGLYAPGIMLKRNTKQVNDFMKLWFNEVKKYSYRDIISFSYILWKTPIEIDLLDFKKTYRRFK